MSKGREKETSSLVEHLVFVNKVSKVVKGGRKFSFAALVVVGDKKGRVGFGTGKAKEVGDARVKAYEAAKRSMVRIALKEGRTLHHDSHGSFGAANVVVRSAPSGTGVIAGGPMRAVFESLGVHDVVAKSVGTSNPYNMVAATFDALQNIDSPKYVAEKRGKAVSEIVKRRNSALDSSAVA